MKILHTLSLLALSTQISAASSVMIDFGTSGSPVANAADLGLDGVIAKNETDAIGGAFNVSVGSETLTVDLVDVDGAFISRDRGTTFFTDNTTSDILTPYVQDLVLASDSDFDLTISGLTIGNTYTFDFYVADHYSSNGGLSTETIVGDATFGNVGSVSWRHTATSDSSTYDSLATNVISTGAFVAGATSETFTITGSDQAPRGSISALTITTIPEPGTFALLAGVSALGYMMIRRRR